MCVVVLLNYIIHDCSVIQNDCDAYPELDLDDVMKIDESSREQKLEVDQIYYVCMYIIILCTYVWNVFLEICTYVQCIDILPGGIASWVDGCIA